MVDKMKDKIYWEYALSNKYRSLENGKVIKVHPGWWVVRRGNVECVHDFGKEALYCYNQNPERCYFADNV